GLCRRPGRGHGGEPRRLRLAAAGGSARARVRPRLRGPPDVVRDQQRRAGRGRGRAGRAVRHARLLRLRRRSDRQRDRHRERLQRLRHHGHAGPRRPGPAGRRGGGRDLCAPGRGRGRRPLRGRAPDLPGKLLDSRASVVAVMRARWVQVTVSTLLLQLTSWAVLVLALRGLETGTGQATVTWTESLAAFSFARVASFIPGPPGGLGTVDAALTALLTGYGASSSQALAADLVWRAATYLPQVVLGSLTFLWWRVTAARRRQRGQLIRKGRA